MVYLYWVIIPLPFLPYTPINLLLPLCHPATRLLLLVPGRHLLPCCFPPAPPCTVHVIARRSRWFSVSEFPLFMTRMLGRTGNTKSGVCRFFTLPSVRSLYAFIFCLPFFSLCHILLHPHPNITPCPLFDFLIPPHIAYNDTYFFFNPGLPLFLNSVPFNPFIHLYLFPNNNTIFPVRSFITFRPASRESDKRKTH